MRADFRNFFNNISRYKITSVETQVSQTPTTFPKKPDKSLGRYVGIVGPRQIYTFQAVTTLLQKT